MNTLITSPTQASVLASRVVARLDAGTQSLPHHVSERLRAARERAVSARKLEFKPRLVPSAVVTPVGGGAAALSWGTGDEDLMNWLYRLAGLLPLLALVAGLLLISTQQNERQAREVAEVDTALLTDDLPPAAYADPGFVYFLKNNPERGQL